MSETKKETLVASVVVSARLWKDARREFIALPAGSPLAQATLSRLANAEDNLQRYVVELERHVAETGDQSMPRMSQNVHR